MTKLIDIAYECFRLNNFETVVQLLSGIEMAPVSRLKLSWQLVPDRVTARLAELRNLFDPKDNWKVYRGVLAHVGLPAIPYLGIYLQSLTFAEDGNETFTKLKLLNWFKFSVIGGIIEEILKFRSKKYRFKEVPEIKVPLLYTSTSIIPSTLLTLTLILTLTLTF